jgi:hypothetical protein
MSQDFSTVQVSFYLIFLKMKCRWIFIAFLCVFCLKYMKGSVMGTVYLSACFVSEIWLCKNVLVNYGFGLFWYIIVYMKLKLILIFRCDSLYENNFTCDIKYIHHYDLWSVFETFAIWWIFQYFSMVSIDKENNFWLCSMVSVFAVNLATINMYLRMSPNSKNSFWK